MNTSAVASTRNQVIHVLAAFVGFGFAFKLTLNGLDISTPLGVCLLMLWPIKIDGWFRPSFDLVSNLVLDKASNPALLSTKGKWAMLVSCPAALYGGLWLAHAATQGAIWAVRIVWTIASAYIG
jgi:hypothetical protein